MAHRAGIAGMGCQRVGSNLRGQTETDGLFQSLMVLMALGW